MAPRFPFVLRVLLLAAILSTLAGMPSAAGRAVSAALVAPCASYSSAISVWPSTFHGVFAAGEKAHPPVP